MALTPNLAMILLMLSFSLLIVGSGSSIASRSKVPNQASSDLNRSDQLSDIEEAYIIAPPQARQLSYYPNTVFKGAYYQPQIAYRAGMVPAYVQSGFYGPRRTQFSLGQQYPQAIYQSSEYSQPSELYGFALDEIESPVDEPTVPSFNNFELDSLDTAQASVKGKIPKTVAKSLDKKKKNDENGKGSRSKSSSTSRPAKLATTSQPDELSSTVEPTISSSTSQPAGLESTTQSPKSGSIESESEARSGSQPLEFLEQLFSPMKFLFSGDSGAIKIFQRITDVFRQFDGDISRVLRSIRIELQDLNLHLGIPFDMQDPDLQSQFNGFFTQAELQTDILSQIGLSPEQRKILADILELLNLIFKWFARGIDTLLFDRLEETLTNLQVN